jgi:hypothetical protein
MFPEVLVKHPKVSVGHPGVFMIFSENPGEKAAIIFR